MTSRFTVNQEKPGLFRFTATRPELTPVEIYQYTEAERDVLLDIVTSHNFVIKLPETAERYYFRLKHDGQDYVLGERTLRIAGMNNFRDLGGYETVAGRWVKWGCLYRSDQLYNATEKGLKHVQYLNIKTIIDYRSPEEVKKYPNPVLAEPVITYHYDPNAHAAELAAQFTARKDTEDQALIAEIKQQKEQGSLGNYQARVLQQYRNFVTSPEAQRAFGTMLKTLANPQAPASIQHCRGGKDRTGFGAMLLLGVLGVRSDDLVRDYMITETNRRARNVEKMAGYRKLTTDETILNTLYSFIETRPEFILASYEAILEKYDSLTQYAHKALGVSKNEIKRLQDLYLE